MRRRLGDAWERRTGSRASFWFGRTSSGFAGGLYLTTNPEHIRRRIVSEMMELALPVQENLHDMCEALVGNAGANSLTKATALVIQSAPATISVKELSTMIGLESIRADAVSLAGSMFAKTASDVRSEVAELIPSDAKLAMEVADLMVDHLELELAA